MWLNQRADVCVLPHDGRVMPYDGRVMAVDGRVMPHDGVSPYSTMISSTKIHAEPPAPKCQEGMVP